MYFRAEDEDTICALSTPVGTGGIAVVRVSGSAALLVAKKICQFVPETPESHRTYFGVCSSVRSQEPLDEVLATFFAEGRSFTGEETVEISCHGGPIIIANLLSELVVAGARVAKRGEFTYRAFMNGRLDLVQAESVLGLIESRSKPAAKVALRQLRGELSIEYARIEDGLVWLLAHLEASIDFSTEGIEIVPKDEAIRRVQELHIWTEKLISSYAKGRVFSDGLEIALVGRPNAGKSSLLNALLQEDRAIVTPHEGTTRDTIEGRVAISGVPVTFVDTAGLRKSDNEIERMGIERSRLAMERADLVFYVIDPFMEGVEADLRSLVSKATSREHFVLNKSDMDPNGKCHDVFSKVLFELGVPSERVFSVSSKDRTGLNRVEAYLTTHVSSHESDSENVVTQARHLDLLQKIHTCLEAALRLINDESSPEFIAFELQDGVRAVHELLGKEFNEQVIDRIFQEFCLGK
jgi:tRNA modification GTPase